MTAPPDLLAETPLREKNVDRCAGFFFRLADQDALAGSKAIGFEDGGKRRAGDNFQRGVGVTDYFVAGGIGRASCRERVYVLV